MTAMTSTLVLKFGGELLETVDQRARVAAAAAALARTRPVAIVHGGGRAIDAELQRRGIAPRKVDGLRVTDAPTLEAVIAVLAGSANTDLVASLVSQGVRAVGLTGVDAGFGRATRSADHQATSGDVVDLGLVGDPVAPDASLVELLLVNGYVPVIASLGIDAADRASRPATATVLNVNADVMACRLAAALGAELVIAGTTPGVLDAGGSPIATLDLEGMDRMIATGAATAGMVAKLSACRVALEDGVTRISLIDGRHLDRDGLTGARGTTLVAHDLARAGAL